jgi:Gas vesicle synthesis protein GvpL/GvpF
VSPFRLYGVAIHDANDTPGLPAGVQLESFRDIAAVVAETPHSRPTASLHDVEAHRAAVGAVFARHAILPAPAGTVFRGHEALTRWLELHYVTLSDGLAWVEGRMAARVHIARRAERPLTSPGRTEELAIDIDDASAETFRVLRRHAVASVTLRGRPAASAADTAAASAAFLVERERWRVFQDVVAEEARRDPDLLFRLTGPWPPYDFVRMQFGG